MTKKLDLIGILIYAGLAGSVLFMVLTLFFTVIKDIIFGV